MRVKFIPFIFLIISFLLPRYIIHLANVKFTGSSVIV